MLIVISIIAALVLLCLVIVLPALQVRDLRKSGVPSTEIFKAENEARRTIAQIFGGIVILVGLYFTWQELVATRQTLELTQQRQITERFAKAIEQLRNDKLEVRLGAIYSLERIARDSQIDRGPIINLLTAFVRQNAPSSEVERVCGTSKASGVLPLFLLNPPISEDIQAIMTVIGRRTWTFGNGEEYPIDLRHTDLRGARLSGANLKGALLIHSNLEGAILDRANLEAANISGANLECVILNNSHMAGTILSGSGLFHAILSEANLRGARFDGTTLTQADLRGADLTDAKYLTPDQINRAFIDEKTKLPNDFK